jgi:nicotinamidase-related amidase
MRNYKEVLLSPDECVVAIIDHQPQMYFGVQGKVRECIQNSALGLAKAAKAFGVPVVLTTVAAETFSGLICNKLQEVFPEQLPIDRTSLNAWEDSNFRMAIEETKRQKLILAGLWTEICVTLPALSAMFDGYDVYVVADACGGSSKDAHKHAIGRMSKAGAKIITWQQLMLEWQRDWNNLETYGAVMQVEKEHGGAYGLGVEYVESMLLP